MSEPIIPFADPDNGPPEVRRILEQQSAITGEVHNSMRTYAHRPAIADAMMGLWKAVGLDEDSTLPSSIKGKLGIICSSINGCSYCTSHQCSAAASPKPGTLGLTEQQITALINGTDEGSSSVERACFKYARLASFDPSSVTVDVLEELKTALTPPQIVELASVVGLWKMANTIHDTLHFPIEDSMQQFAHFIDKK